MNNFDYTIGSTITYNLWGGDTRTVKVTHKDEDIKNGDPGFDGTVVGTGKNGRRPETVWGYDNQICKVDKF
mgnify:FL=1|tara:strand:+ start:1470 stop:1682 length:213 start_codon:yes stop_codon:yes gene_type:complete